MKTWDAVGFVLKAKGSEDKVVPTTLRRRKTYVRFLAIPLGGDVLTIGMHYDLIGEVVYLE